MRPGCCCTPKAKVSTLSQATHHLQPAYLYTCIFISSAIRYYPEICRRYSAPTNPSVTIICFRYRSTEPAMAAPASIGHSRIRYCKCRARLGPGAGRSPLVSWSRISVSGHMPPAEDGARCTHCFRWVSCYSGTLYSRQRV